MVDGINDILCRDHASAEPTAVKTSNGVFAALDTVKLDVDLAIIVVECKADVHDLAILLVTLVLDVVLELVLPVGVGLSVSCVSKQCPIIKRAKYLLVLVVHVLQENTSGSSGLLNHRLLYLLSLWSHLLLWFISTSQLAHERITAVIAEVDTANVSIIECARTARLVDVAGCCSVEIACTTSVSATATHTGEGGSLSVALTTSKALEE